MKVEKNKEYILNLVALKNSQKEIQYKFRQVEQRERGFKADCKLS